MQKVNFATAMNNLKENFMLLVSAISVLCLFLLPLSPLLMIATIFFAIVAIALLRKAKLPMLSNKLSLLTSALIAIFILIMGLYMFTTTWTPPKEIIVLASALHLTKPILIFVVGLICCVVGFYATNILSCWIVTWAIRLLKEKLPEQRKSEIVANLKRNWFFPISAMAFFCLALDNTLGYCIGLLVAFVVMIIISSQVPSFWNFVRGQSIFLKILCFLSSLGICLGNQTEFNRRTLKLVVDFGLPTTLNKIFLFIGYFGAILAVFFVYCCVFVFWKKIKKIIYENSIFTGITIAERIIYSILISASLVYVVFSFLQTDAFYGTEYSFDIIYTSDSPTLVQRIVYLALTNQENDLRQPLFALFAAPFVGIPYLFGKLFCVSASVQAMLLNIVQVIMLFVANFMLTKMMQLNPIKRLCFMLLASCTYTHLLFTLMMEQYIIAYFWLVFCMYLICKNRHPDRIVMWGAGGTLLTSAVLLPFMSNNNPIRNFKKWFADMVKYGAEFIAVIVAFCRFDVIFNLISQISFLSAFTGKKITFIDKFYQYTSFVANCFVAPDADVNTTAVDHISWQLNPVTSISLIGVAIVLLVIVSAIMNRNKKSSLLSIGWVAFSVVMLLCLGWGTKENGLILYALYFGWAFLVLLFQLVEAIEDKLNVKFLVPIFSIGCTVVLILINIPAIAEMLSFAITYYPA